MLIQFEKDLRVEIGIEILPDRTLDGLDEEMEFDDGELVEKVKKNLRTRKPPPTLRRKKLLPPRPEPRNGRYDISELHPTSEGSFVF